MGRVKGREFWEYVKPLQNTYVKIEWDLELYQNGKLVTINKFQPFTLKMNEDIPKASLSSISSKSFGPCIRSIQPSGFFEGGKQSFQANNTLKQSEHIPIRDVKNSLDALMSNINGVKTNHTVKNIINLYNSDEAKVKIQENGFQPILMGEVQSESEEVINYNQNQHYEPSLIKYQNNFQQPANSYWEYFPKDLANVLNFRDIPLCYVRSIMNIRQQQQIKSTRRLKVERYLEKRRKKTWDRKICYNCRQKVAEERLRIKGKFIKKRRAMEILGITTPIDMVSLKEKLQILLRNKSNEEIDYIIKVQEYP